MIENLYELVGGHQTIKAATERFYEKVLEDDSLRHFFNQTDMAHLRSRQVMFISKGIGHALVRLRQVQEVHRPAEQGATDQELHDVRGVSGAFLPVRGVDKRPENRENEQQYNNESAAHRRCFRVYVLSVPRRLAARTWSRTQSHWRFR